MRHQNIFSRGLDANKRLQEIPTTLLFYISHLGFIFFFSSSLHGGNSLPHWAMPLSQTRSNASHQVVAPHFCTSVGWKVVKETFKQKKQACKLERKSPQVLFCAAHVGQTCMQMTAVVRIWLRDSGCSFSTSHCKQRREHAAMNNASSRNFKVSDAAEPNVNYFRR